MQKKKEKEIETEGEVLSVNRGNYVVHLDTGHEVKAQCCGKMRQRRIKCRVGDRVKLNMSVYDLTRARITFRL